MNVMIFYEKKSYMNNKWVIWNFDVLKNNSGIICKFTFYYLKESWWLDFDRYFSFNIFWKFLLLEIDNQYSLAVLGATSMSGLNPLMLVVAKKQLET